jgi:hypothetical protein
VSEPVSTQTVSPLGALRGFGVMLGGSLALAGASLASSAAAVEALRAGRRPRMASTARGHARRGRLAGAYGLLIEIPHFVMERRMLLGIKERAERTESPATP